MPAARPLAPITLVFLLGSSVTAGAEEDLWEANPLENPSFEDGEGLPARWSKTVGAQTAAGGSASEVESDEAVPADGKRCLRFRVADGNQVFHALTSEPLRVKPGTRYRLAGKMRTQDVKPSGRQSTNSNLFISFRDEKGRGIRIHGYPVVGTEPLLGTHDWRSVERVVRAPANAASAVIGCFLSCSGTAWFDAVSLAALREISWQTKESSRFLYSYEGAEGPTAQVLTGNDRNLERLEKLFGLTHPQKIAYYKYASNARKQAITGDGGNAHVEGSEIHSIFWADRHEVVHVLTNHALGSSTALLGEGVAVYLSGSWQGQPVHAAARKLHQLRLLPPLTALVETTGFRSHPDQVTYPQSGSFVGFLIDSHGIERFKKLYPLEPRESAANALPGRFQDLYGKTLAQMESDWLRFLEK